jgi:hypothetical protein
MQPYELCDDILSGRAAEFDTSLSSSSSSAASRPDPPLPAPNLNAAVFVKVGLLYSCRKSRLREKNGWELWRVIKV